MSTTNLLIEQHRLLEQAKKGFENRFELDENTVQQWIIFFILRERGRLVK